MIAAGFGMGVFEQFGGFILGAEYQQALIVLLLLAVLASGSCSNSAYCRPCNDPHVPPSVTIGLLLLVGVAARCCSPPTPTRSPCSG